MKFSLFKTIVVSAGLAVGTANAGIISTVSSSSSNGVNTCSTSSNVTLDYIAKSSDPNTKLNVNSYHSTTCGLYSGNDSGNANIPSINKGFFDDGLLNKETHDSGYSFNDFIRDEDLLDLNGDEDLDPGWIYLGKQDGNNFEYGEIDGVNLGNVTVGGNQFGSLFDFLLLDNDRWGLNVNATAIEGATALLGRLSTFDHLAFVVKTGNVKDDNKVKVQGKNNSNAGGNSNFEIFDFNFNDIFAIENQAQGSPVFNFLTPYYFEGDLSSLAVGEKDNSHISIWARDPIIEVPEPSTILIFSVSLFGLAIRKLKK